MGNFTRLNLRDDVENMAPKFGMPEGMESRFAQEALGMEKNGMTLFHLPPNVRIPFGHRHADQEEVYVVAEGSARMKVGDEILELRRFDAVRVPGDVMRQTEGGPDGAIILAFGEPTGRDDSELVPGWWSDE